MLNRARQRFSAPSVPTIIWAAIPLVSIVALVILCACGLYNGDPLDLGFFFIVAVLTGFTSLERDRISPPSEPSATRNVVLLICATFLAWLSLEETWNDRYQLIPFSLAALELALIGVVVAAAYFLSQRHGVGPALVAAFCQFIGIAQYFVMSFKNAAILPSDVLALGTAAAVAGGYRYVFDARVVMGVAYCLAAIGLCAHVRPPLPAAAPAAARRRVAGNVCGGAGLLAAMMLFVTLVNFYDLSVTLDYWWTLNKYREQGFFPTFILFAQQLPLKPPEGYTTEKAETMQANYAKRYEDSVDSSREKAVKQFNELKPCVVAVMNETFADLTIFQNLITGYEGPKFFKSVPDGTLATGPLAVSVYGGGTCNTEFEFLTGNSLALTGGGKNPYSLYDLSDVESMAHQFKDAGYSTVAIHPNWPDNWSRARIYPQLGFDEFLSIHDFAGADTYHDHVSDAATYDRILELINETDEPLFVFDVTMQNHSGYDTGIIPAEDKLNYNVDSLSSNTRFQLNEYLSCITESDRALQEFIEALERLDRPVAVVFFGDHQPYFTNQLQDIYSPNGSDLSNVVQEYQTSYLIWANYDVSGSSEVTKGMFTSPNYLGMMTMERIGAPLSKFQESQLAMRDDIPVFTLMCYLDKKGMWHQFGHPDNASDQKLQNLLTVGYLNFGSKV